MSKITQAARDQSCIRCGARDGTVVAAHINGPIAAKLGRGMADDIFSAHLCFRCHDMLDYRAQTARIGPVTADKRQAEWMELVLLTIKRLREQGVV